MSGRGSARGSVPGLQGLEKWAARLFIPLLFGALVLAFLWARGHRAPDWRAWFDGPERDTWRAETIDGRDVSQQRMTIVIADGEIRGGRDGCNFWGYSGDPDPVTGERQMITTLAACADTPERRAYRAIAHWRADFRLIGEDRLEVTFGDVTGQFLRWTDELAERERQADEQEMERLRPSDEPARLPPASRALPASPPPPPSPPPVAMPE